MVKRFPVMGITRDKEYVLTRGTDNTKVHYFSANPNGEAEVMRIVFRPNPKLKTPSFEYDFSTLAIKGRGSYGNILTKKPVKSIVKKEEGVSTLGAREIWFDDTVKRLNVAERGTYLGAFLGDDRIFSLMSSGHYRHFNFDLSNHFDEDMILIEKFDPKKIMTAVFLDATQGFVYLKRFNIEANDKKIRFIGDHADSKLLAYSMDYLPVLQVKFDEKANGKPIDPLIIDAAEFIGLKSYKAKGKRISTNTILQVKFLKPKPYTPPVEEIEPPTVESSESTDNGKEKTENTEDQKETKKTDKGGADSQAQIEFDL